MLEQRGSASNRPIDGAGADGAAEVGGVTTARPATCADPAAASHELRTPLNAIQGNLGLLLDGVVGPLSAEARVCLADIQRAARRLRVSIEDLLIELDQGAPSRGTEDWFDLITLVRGVLGSAAADLLEVRPDDARLELWGPPIWLHATAMAMVELHDAAAPGLPLELELPPRRRRASVELRATWAGFAVGDIAPARLPLLTAIMARQGGWLISSEDGVRLYWRHRRRVHSDGSRGPEGPTGRSSSLAGR